MSSPQKWDDHRKQWKVIYKGFLIVVAVLLYLAVDWKILILM